MYIISDTCFSDFTWFQKAFLLFNIELSFAGLLFFGIQYHFLVYSALQCHQPSASVRLITFETAPLPRKTARDELSALCRLFSQKAGK